MVGEGLEAEDGLWLQGGEVALRGEPEGGDEEGPR